MITWRSLVAWCFVLGVAAFIRFYQLGAEDYWLDELHSLVNSAGQRAELEAIPHSVILRDIPRYSEPTAGSGIGAVWRTMAHDSHPPVYFVLLRVWRGMLGDGESATRSLSALLSVLSIIPLALIVGRWEDRRIVPYSGTYTRLHLRLVSGQQAPLSPPLVRGEGLGAATVAALAFSNIHMAQQARPYVLGMLFVTLCAWLLSEWAIGWATWTSRRKAVAAIGYAFFAMLAMMTHYFTGFVLLAQVVYAGFVLRRRALHVFVGAVGLAAVAWLVIWGRAFLGQWDFIAAQDWLLEPHQDHLVRTLMRVSDLPVRLLLNHEPFTYGIIRSVVGAGVILGCAWVLRKGSHEGTKLRRHGGGGVGLFALWYAIPTVAFLLIDLFGQRQMLSHIRYSFVALPGLIGLLVLAVQRLLRAAQWVGLFIFVAAVWMSLRLPAIENPHARQAAELIANEARAGDLIVYDAIDWPRFWASRLWTEVSYYLPPPAHSLPFVLLRDRPEPGLVAQLEAYDRVIVVSPRAEEEPNPWPEGLELTQKTGYVRRIGPIYLFERRDHEP